MMNFNPLFIDNNLSGLGLGALRQNGKAAEGQGTKNYLFADIIKVYEEELNVANSKLGDDLLVNLEGLKDFIVTKTDTKVIDGFQNSLNNLEELSVVSNSNTVNIEDAKISSKVFVLTPDNLLAFLGSINNIISESESAQPNTASGSSLFYLNDFKNTLQASDDPDRQLLDIKKLFSVMSNKEAIKFNFTTNGEKLTVAISQLNEKDNKAGNEENKISGTDNREKDDEKPALSQNLLLNIPGFSELEKADTEFYKIEIVHIHKGDQKIFDIKTGQIRQPQIDNPELLANKNASLNESPDIIDQTPHTDKNSDKIAGEIKPVVKNDSQPATQKNEIRGIDLSKLNLKDLDTELTKEEFHKIQEVLNSKERKIDSTGKVYSKIITSEENRTIAEFNPPVVKKESTAKIKLSENVKEILTDNDGVKKNIPEIKVESNKTESWINSENPDKPVEQKIQIDKPEASPQVKIGHENKIETKTVSNSSSNINADEANAVKKETNLSKDEKEFDRQKEQNVETKETAVKEQKETDRKQPLNDQFAKELNKQHDNLIHKADNQVERVNAGDNQPKIENGSVKNENLKEAFKTVKAAEVISEIVKSVDGTKQHLSFKLEPESLGKLTVSIDYVNNKLHAHIEVENEQIKQFVQSNLDQLKNNLQNNGVQVNSINVGLNNNEQKNTKYVNPKRKFHGKIADVKTEDVPEVKKMMGYNTYDFLV
ncbi:flagellar hook-length control protein FliK [Melioribacter sp. Ez-97]|uniref:flagellar hook-length control protein FliK n=1 Tax=Melioribacter sp. Ez-97 TaxID=3423434 RepID=UPI003ED8457C